LLKCQPDQLQPDVLARITNEQARHHLAILLALETCPDHFPEHQIGDKLPCLGCDPPLVRNTDSHDADDVHSFPAVDDNNLSAPHFGYFSGERVRSEGRKEALARTLRELELRDGAFLSYNYLPEQDSE